MSHHPSPTPFPLSHLPLSPLPLSHLPPATYPHHLPPTPYLFLGRGMYVLTGNAPCIPPSAQVALMSLSMCDHEAPALAVGTPLCGPSLSDVMATFFVE